MGDCPSENGCHNGHQHRRHKLCQVQGRRDQRHHCGGRRLARLHGRLRHDEGDARTVGKAHKDGTQKGACPAAQQSQQQIPDQEAKGRQELRLSAQQHLGSHEQKTSAERDKVHARHDDRDIILGDDPLGDGLQGKVGRVDEEGGHQKEHGQDVHDIGPEHAGSSGSLLFPSVLFPSALSRRGLLRDPVIGQEKQAEHNADEAHQVHQEADTPADVCQKAGQQRGDDAAHLIHGRGIAHQAHLLLRAVVVGQKPGGQRHDDAHADPHQGARHEHCENVVKKSGRTAAHRVEQKAHEHQCPGSEHLAELWKNKVGNHNEQRRHTDDHLHKKLIRIGKVSLNDPQRRCYCGACHDCQQRQGQDAHCQCFPMVCLIRQKNHSFIKFQKAKKMRRPCLDLRIFATQRKYVSTLFEKKSNGFSKYFTTQIKDEEKTF